MLALPRTQCFLRSNLSLKSCDWSSLTCMWTNGPSFFRLRFLVWRHLYKLISNWKFKINQLSEKVHLVFFTIKIAISCKTASSAKRHHQLITSSGTNCFQSSYAIHIFLTGGAKNLKKKNCLATQTVSKTDGVGEPKRTLKMSKLWQKHNQCYVLFFFSLSIRNQRA